MKKKNTYVNTKLLKKSKINELSDIKEDANKQMISSQNENNYAENINLNNFFTNKSKIILENNKNISLNPLDKNSSDQAISRLSSLDKVSLPEQCNTNRTIDTISKKLEFDEIGNLNKNKEKLPYTNAELDNLKDIVNKKISSLGKLHIFCLNNVNIILKIYKEFTDILFRKISFTFDQNKNFLKYFKDIINGYMKFSLDLEKANINISNLNDENQLLSDNITKLIISTQDTIKTNFEAFSKCLNETLITNGPLKKIKDIIIRFEQIKKNVLNDLKNLEYKKEKLEKKFNGKGIPIFTNFKKYENKIIMGETCSIKELNNLLEENDFFLIEIEISKRINKLFKKVYVFLNSYKQSITDLKKCIIEYVDLLKDTVEKFIGENKKIYGGNMNIDFDQMQKFYESLTKDSLEKNFIVSIVLRRIIFLSLKKHIFFHHIFLKV